MGKRNARSSLHYGKVKEDVNSKDDAWGSLSQALVGYAKNVNASPTRSQVCRGSLLALVAGARLDYGSIG